MECHRSRQKGLIMIKVSVIVPVYNVENYLDKCLDSLINQTLEEIEIIVVNDGATDNSQKIIDKYSSQNNKIKAFQKINGGLSDARNYGIVHAVGEYIGFIDSDDFVDYDMYELLYEKAKKNSSDIVECNLRHTYPDKEDIEIGREIYNKKEMLTSGRSVVWNKIYKRDWLIDTGVIFPKGLIYEDVEYFLKLIPHIRSYSYVKAASVHYVQRNNSINNFSSLKTMDILKILRNIYNYYTENGYIAEYEQEMEFLFARILLCSSFARMIRIQDKKQRQFALLKNWELLNEIYPNWKKNSILHDNKSYQAFYMKAINRFTYRICSAMLPGFYHITNSCRK